jgi:hypothetical protein
MTNEECSIINSFDEDYLQNLLSARVEDVGGSKTFVVYYNDYGASLSGALPSSDTWHTYEIYLYRHATEGNISFWIDGVLVDSDTGVDTGDNNPANFYFGIDSIGGDDIQGTVYMDDIVLDNSRYIGTGWRVQEGLAVGSPYHY